MSMAHSSKKASEIVASETFPFAQFSKGCDAAHGCLPTFDMTVKIDASIKHTDGSAIYVGADKSCWSPSKGKFVLPEDTNIRRGS